MPSQHRRTYGAVYEMALAAAFTVQPFIAFLLADNPFGFRLLALPGGLAVTVVPALIYFAIPESPLVLRKGRPRAAADIVKRIIRQSGSRVPQLTVAARGDNLPTARERLPPYWALFGRGHLRWTTVGILSGVCAGTAGFSDPTAAAKSAGQSGYGRHLQFRAELSGVLREHPGKGLYRVPDGDHRAALDDRLRARRIAARPFLDVNVAPGRAIRDGRNGSGRADHRLHRTVGLRRHPSLPVRAIPDGAARAGNPSARRSGGPSPASWRHF